MLDIDASPSSGGGGGTASASDLWLVGMDDDLLDLLALTIAQARIAPTRLQPAEAQARLESDQPRLAIVDLGSPVGPHVRLIDALKLRQVPLLIITARDGVMERVVAKPFSPANLLARVTCRGC